MRTKTIIGSAIIGFLAYLYWSGTYFIGSESQAREEAINMFNGFTEKYKLPKELFDGPGKPQKGSGGYFYFWNLKPLDQNYPRVQIFASVHGAFNSGMSCDTDAIEFFKAQCERDKKASKKYSSPFRGFCD